jgi:hypothetical protein
MGQAHPSGVGQLAPSYATEELGRSFSASLVIDTLVSGLWSVIRHGLARVRITGRTIWELGLGANHRRASSRRFVDPGVYGRPQEQVDNRPPPSRWATDRDINPSAEKGQKKTIGHSISATNQGSRKRKKCPMVFFWPFSAGGLTCPPDSNVGHSSRNKGTQQQHH